MAGRQEARCHGELVHYMKKLAWFKTETNIYVLPTGSAATRDSVRGTILRAAQHTVSSMPGPVICQAWFESIEEGPVVPNIVVCIVNTSGDYCDVHVRRASNPGCSRTEVRAASINFAARLKRANIGRATHTSTKGEY